MKTESSENAETIMSQIAANVQKLATNAPGAREDAISQARRLIAALETPWEAVLRTIWEEPTRYTTIRLGLDLKIFETLAESESPKTVVELCIPTKADPDFVTRITRHLAATGVIHEVGAGVYTSTSFSKTLAIPKYAGGVKFCFDSSQPVYATMPSYFAKNGFKNPTDAMDGPFQHTNGPVHGFAWLNERPDVLEAFQAYVYAQRSERPAWIDFYPVHENLITGMDTEGDRSAFVDLGGGMGDQLEEFRIKVPEWKGRLVLQEQESVSSHAVGLNERIEVISHDFFTPQPIKGARIYYLRFILHDWPDDRCRVILQHLKSAMEPGYSKLLLNEAVLTDQQASWQHTSLDIHMMALAASQERTETQWRELISSAGLRITGIWGKGKGNESIIEIVN